MTAHGVYIYTSFLWSGIIWQLMHHFYLVHNGFGQATISFHPTEEGWRLQAQWEADKRVVSPEIKWSKNAVRRNPQGLVWVFKLTEFIHSFFFILEWSKRVKGGKRASIFNSSYHIFSSIWWLKWNGLLLQKSRSFNISVRNIKIKNDNYIYVINIDSENKLLSRRG